MSITCSLAGQYYGERFSTVAFLRYATIADYNVDNTRGWYVSVWLCENMLTPVPKLVPLKILAVQYGMKIICPR